MDIGTESPSPEPGPIPHGRAGPQAMSPAAGGAALELVLRRMPACLWSTDMDLRFTASTGAGLAALGHEQGELVGMTIDEYTAGTDSRSPEYHRRARAGESIDYETDAGPCKWQVHLEPLRGKDGDIVGTIGLALDVTDEVATRAHARQLETRYRQLVEQIPVITYREEVAAPNRTVFVSPQVEAMFGYTPAEWLEDGGVLWYRIVHPDDHDRITRENDRTNETGEPFDCEYRIVASDGREVWVHDESHLIRDEDGRALFWQGVYVDVTERHRAEEALRVAFEAERDAAERLRALDDMKNTFLAAVSHELRTPLSSILGIALTLDRDDMDVSNEDARELLHGLAGNARKLERLLSDLLDLDRLSRGIVGPRRSPTDVADLAQSVAGSVDIAREHRVRVEAVGSVRVDVDPAQVERIVENLVSNAARHTPAGSGITVRVLPEGGGVRIEVDDEGPGIPEPMRDIIFQPFVQVPGRLAHSPGVGIGLSLVARFAELHGGRAWVDERPGGGSSFRVVLPGPDEAGAASAPDAG
ncbi:MAG TPA: ATP-binding protein [Actinomycetota bacterium]|nr:ATP-binding protein [Actinomycetota bacterium]